jgi:hypothetical protein
VQRFEYEGYLDRPLWPELVQEDYDTIVAITEDYVMNVSLPYFTVDSLRGYLENLESRDVWLPEDDAEWESLFDEMQSDIQQSLAERGRRYMWISKNAGGEVLHALARWVSLEEFEAIEKRTKAPVEEPVEELPGAQLPIAPLRRVAPRLEPSPPALAPALTQIFRGEVRQVHTGEFVPRVAQYLRVSEAVARTVIAQAISEGSLHKYPGGGRVWYSVAPPDEASAGKTRAGKPERKDKTRPLNESEILVATTVLDILARPELHPEQGRTIRQLEIAIRGRLPGDQLRRLLRVMQSVNLVVIDDPGKIKKKIRKLPKVRIIQEVKNRWGENDRDEYMDRLGEATIVG